MAKYKGNYPHRIKYIGGCGRALPGVCRVQTNNGRYYTLTKAQTKGDFPKLRSDIREFDALATLSILLEDVDKNSGAGIMTEEEHTISVETLKRSIAAKHSEALKLGHSLGDYWPNCS